MSAAAIAVGAVGLGTAIYGGIKASKARKALEKQKTPVYTPSKAISDYYQTALNRFNTNPYQSNFYQQAQKQADRGLATGIGALQDRHSAGNIGALVQGNDDAMQRAGVQAEGLQSKNFGQLGQAASALTGEQHQAFDTNEMLPYEQKRALYEAQAIGGTQTENAGISTMGSAFNMYNSGQQAKGLSGGGGGLGRGAYSSGGTGLAYTGGADINHQVGGPQMGYIDPNSYYR